MSGQLFCIWAILLVAAAATTPSSRSTRTLGSLFRGRTKQVKEPEPQVFQNVIGTPLVYQVRYYDHQQYAGGQQGKAVDKVGGSGVSDQQQQGMVQQVVGNSVVTDQQVQQQQRRYQYHNYYPYQGGQVVPTQQFQYPPFVYVQVPGRTTPVQVQVQQQQQQQPQQYYFPQAAVPPSPVVCYYYVDPGVTEVVGDRVVQQQQQQQQPYVVGGGVVVGVVQQQQPGVGVVQPGVIQPGVVQPTVVQGQGVGVGVGVVQPETRSQPGNGVHYTNRVRPPNFTQQVQQQQPIVPIPVQVGVGGVGVGYPYNVPSGYGNYQSIAQQAYYPHYFNPVVAAASSQVPDFYYQPYHKQPQEKISSVEGTSQGVKEQQGQQTGGSSDKTISEE